MNTTQESNPPSTTTVSYRPLPTQFVRDGFTFTQLSRIADVALFEKKKPAHSKAFYEVVIVQKRGASTLLGKPVPPYEFMPLAEQWGVKGWSYSNLESAIKAFHIQVDLQIQRLTS